MPKPDWGQTLHKGLQETKTTLEPLIDKYGLANVLQLLSEICAEKSAHIQTNYPGPPVRGGPRKGEPTTSPLAKSWRRRAAIIDTAMRRITRIHP